MTIRFGLNLIVGMLSCMVACAQGTASIAVRGTLTDWYGHPAPRFQILVLPTSMSSSPQQHVFTSEQGEFEFENLAPGSYAIYPYDNSLQYPLRADLFMSDKPDRFKLEKQGQNIFLNLHLPPPAAVLRLVLMAKGEPLTQTDVVLCHESERTRSAEVHTDDQGKLLYALPARESIYVTVKTPFGSFNSEPIALLPGEAKMLRSDILVPDEGWTQNPDHECVPFRGR